ncbi:hypothetical protein RND71_028579 [Anisodus tanguticus]|uniref:ZF-HD dimerization-type domain-containing protein n=1 Tax=Anisodus tanguticus TaxID=243964 RepID=A0AAE1RL80_9SOLA|nr:hypothetical protein RND71_028579 [Anisodus tanguticus]
MEFENHKDHNIHESKMPSNNNSGELTINAPPQITNFKPKYKECLKNHAVSIGGHAVDGCGEFMPTGEDGTNNALKCAASWIQGGSRIRDVILYDKRSSKSKVDSSVLRSDSTFLAVIYTTYTTVYITVLEHILQGTTAGEGQAAGEGEATRNLPATTLGRSEQEEAAYLSLYTLFQLTIYKLIKKHIFTLSSNRFQHIKDCPDSGDIRAIKMTCGSQVVPQIEVENEVLKGQHTAPHMGRRNQHADRMSLRR